MKPLHLSLGSLLVGITTTISLSFEQSDPPCEEILCGCIYHTAQEDTPRIIYECPIELPKDLPKTFSTTLEVKGVEFTLALKKHQAFGENTRFLIADHSGELKQIDPGVDRSYLGKVEGYPDITVSAVLTNNGLLANLIRPGRSSITIEPILGSKLHEISTADGNVQTKNDPASSSETAVLKSKKSIPILSSSFASTKSVTKSNTSAATLPPTRVMDVLEYEIGVEIGSPALLNNYSGTTEQKVAQAISVAQGIPGNLDARYLRSAGIKHRLGTVIIRTDPNNDPISVANGNDSGGLSAFRNYWNNNPGEVGTTHDLAVYHVRASPSGLAYVNSVGSSNRYALCASNGPTSWADGTLVHEFGHSWSLRHTGDSPINEYDYNSAAFPPSQFYESKPRNNSGSNSAGGSHVFISPMHGGGNHNIGRFSTDEANTIYNIRQRKRNFGNIISNPPATAPFGHRDVVSVSANATTIDVIANDFDINNDVLDARILDTVSHKGGVISLSHGTGPGGRNEILYTAPNGLSGMDFFHYTVYDSTGKTDWAAVYVNVEAPAVINVNQAKYHYDVGTSSSPVFTNSSDIYYRLSDTTFGDLGFATNGPNPVESRDRGSINGINAINRDHIRLRSESSFHHKLRPGVYDILFTIGDATENSNAIEFTGEETEILITKSHGPGAFTNYTMRDVSVLDGELNLTIKNLGFSSNITRIVITGIDGDQDNDGFSDFLETAAGTQLDNPFSRPVLSSQELAGHWPLDEASGGTAADTSGHDHDGIWAGSSGENTWVNGLIGRAARVNDEDSGSGQEHFRISELSSLNSANALSISLWFNQNVESNNNSNYNGLFMGRTLDSSLVSSTEENWGIALEGSSSPRHIDWRVAGGSHPETDNIVGDNVDQWQHILYVWDGSAGTVYLYQNGTLVESSTTETGSILEGGEWRIGDDACCGNREFSGTLDDISIFTEPLNATDSALIYNAGMGGFSVDELLGEPIVHPEVTTKSAHSITQTGATIDYTLINDGGAASTLTLFYGLTAGGTIPENWNTQINLGTLDAGIYSETLSALPANKTYHYAIRASNGVGDFWTDTKTFSTVSTGYSLWSSDNRLTGGSSDDEDGDGLENLLEYALGLDPQSPELKAGTFADSQLRFNKGSEARRNGDITYIIETSSNLQGPWTQVTPTANNILFISYSLPPNQRNIFARLRVRTQE